MDNGGDILQLCRLCLVKDDVNIPIFEEQGDIRQIFLKISSCLPVKVSREDKLPKKICDGCSYKLDMFYEFWNGTASAEKQLLAWLGEAGMNSKMTDGTISAVTQQIKPTETVVKQEAIDPSDIHTEENDDKSYMFQQKFSEEEAGPSATATSNEEPPPPKRARRTAAVKAQIAMDPESDDDEDSGEPLTKVEDESEESEGEDHEPTFVDVPSTSADDQPGPSGVGKDGVEAPVKDTSEITKVRLRKVSFICKTCKRIYSTPNKLRQHLNNIVVKITYFCPPCDEFFDEDHPCNLSGKRCLHCKQLLDKNTNFRNHLCFHREADKTYCKYCQIDITATGTSNHVCAEKHIFDRHIANKTLTCVDENHYRCSGCNDQFKLSDVFLHLHSCLENNVEKLESDEISTTQCTICAKFFVTEEELEAHFDSVTPKVVLFCHKCVNFFYREDDHIRYVSCNSKSELIEYCVMCKNAINRLKPKEHICFHTFTEDEMNDKHKTVLDDYNSFLYLCEFCGKHVPSNLRGDHYRSFHFDFTLIKFEKTCKHCQITFNDKDEYRKHLRIHKSVFLCYVCGKIMKADKTTAHLDTHINVKSYKCKECNKAFSFKVGLSRHMRVHSDVANYKCPTCGKGFKCNFNRKVHMRTHADVKPFECVVCKKTFTTKQWRDNHQKTHKILETNSR